MGSGMLTTYEPSRLFLSIVCLCVSCRVCVCVCFRIAGRCAQQGPPPLADEQPALGFDDGGRRHGYVGEFNGGLV
jgi:hypothetical protein